MIFTPSPAKATNKKNHPIQGSNSNHNAFFFGVVNVEINLANVTTNGGGVGVGILQIYAKSCFLTF